MSTSNKPVLRFLADELLSEIKEEAFNVLETVGVLVEHEGARQLLLENGCAEIAGTGRITISKDLIDKSVTSAPATIGLFDREGGKTVLLGQDPPVFNPGSAALNIFDWETQRQRKPFTSDLVALAAVTEHLNDIGLQSTGLVPADVPHEIADRYRLLIALLYSRKPVVTGTFREDAFAPMHEMLVAIRGDERQLRDKPLAIFDCCPSPPLKWSRLTCQALLDCARTGIPAELVSMPLSGATAPVTLVGSLVQHTAENLSGIVIHQLANRGAPIIYGGSPAATDMRTGTPPMGAIETMIINAAYNEIGRSFGLPTHAYMGLSDAKLLDAQAGAESAVGSLLAAVSGVSVISGPGMLDFESCQSLEKLVLDNEFCGMALRAARGIEKRGEDLAPDLYCDLTQNDLFLTSETTLTWFRKEFFFPSEIIDRQTYQHWASARTDSAADRAHAQVERLLQLDPQLPSHDRVQALVSITLKDAEKCAIEQLPIEKELKTVS